MSIIIGPAWGLISIAIAASLTYNWQSENPPLFAFLTYKDKLMPILNNPEAQGLRYYIGLHDVGTYQDVPKVIVVGVDAQGNDIIDQSSPDSKILNFTSPCPMVCDKEKSSLLHEEFITTTVPVEAGTTRPIPLDVAINMTRMWQAAQDIKSIYISKSDLQGLFEKYGQNQLRFYFGKDGQGMQTVIVVGTDQLGNDILGAEVYSSSAVLCITDETSCAAGSPLYHDE